MTLQLPPIPEQDVPIVLQTSATYDTEDWGDLSRYGIDADTQWWCEAVRRSRRDEAVASLYPPGAGRHQPLFDLILGASDLNEAEAVAHHAIRIGRPLIRVLADRDDRAAWGDLKKLLSPDGVMGGLSQSAWHRLLSWLPGVTELYPTGRWNQLVLEGQGYGGDLWTLSMVASYLGYSGPSANGSARKQMSRWGRKAEGRKAGRGGESLYLAESVKADYAARPGRGKRTDLS